MLENMRHFLEEIMEKAGQPFQILRGDSIHEADAAPNTEKGTGRKYLMFRAGTDIQEEDWLKGTVTGQEFHVMDVIPTVLEGQVAYVQVFYESKRQYEERMKGSQPTFQIGQAYGSIIGTQQHATIGASFDLQAINREIDERGGEDAQVLKAMVTEIQGTLQDQRELPQGGLARYSALIEKHSWIAGAIAQALLGWAIGKM